MKSFFLILTSLQPSNLIMEETSCQGQENDAGNKIDPKTKNIFFLCGKVMTVDGCDNILVQFKT